MRWPWQKQERERRDSGGDFSDAVVRLIEAQAAGTTADASSTAAVEAASGALSRAFAAAEIVGPAWVQEAVSPGVLAQIGRDLVRSGDSMHVIRMGAAGMVRLIPDSSRADRALSLHASASRVWMFTRPIRRLGWHGETGGTTTMAPGHRSTARPDARA